MDKRKRGRENYSGVGNENIIFRGWSYDKQDGIKMGWDNFHHAFMEKIRQGNFWHHNAKIFISKDGPYKCEQCTQELADNKLQKLK